MQRAAKEMYERGKAESMRRLQKAAEERRIKEAEKLKAEIAEKQASGEEVSEEITQKLEAMQASRANSFHSTDPCVWV